MTYEGARSITGPYLALLGANAATVGFVAGFGELVGYALRFVSGYLADKTTRYWAITIFGYLCNLLAVPLLALTNHWWMAASLMILERMGKAIRTPTRDAMLSHACQGVGMGWGFGLHEALDQTGAMLGPLIVAIVLYFKGTYQFSFGILLIPALLALLLLFVAYRQYPNPQSLEVSKENLQTKGFKNSAFWLYLVAASFIAAGYADFPLMAYHLEKTKVLTSIWIPISYSIAMGISGLASLLFGHLYDKKGFIILIFITLLCSLFSPLVFLGDFTMIMLGVVLWGIGVGVHESLMRAIIANMIPSNRRASAYGVFNLGYGVCWFLGSFLMGILYDYSILNLVIFSMVIQLMAIPILWVVMRKVDLQPNQPT